MGGKPHGHILPVCPQNAEVGGVQVQVVGGVVSLPDTATVALTQDVATERRSRSNVGDVWIEGGRQIFRE